MSAKRQTTRAGSFLITEEPGSISRDAAFLAEGENLQAGTLLKRDDGGDLIAWTTDADCAGILFAGNDARTARQSVAIISRLAVVNLALLTFPDGEEAAARDALEAVRIEVRADHAVADTGGGGGGAYVQKWVKFIGGAGAGATLTVTPAESSTLITMSTWVNYSSDELSAGENIIGGTDGFKLVPSWNVLGDIHCRLTGDFSTNTQFDTAGGLITADAPHHVFFCCDTNHPQGAKLLDLIVDGVAIDLTVDDPQDAFVPAISAGDSGSIVIPDAFGGPHDQSYSDFQLWIGQRIAPTEGNLLNFRTAGGEAVNPATAAAAFGQQSVLYSGDAAAFVVNQGTAGTASSSGVIVDV